jgi:hypothetical protein
MGCIIIPKDRLIWTGSSVLDSRIVLLCELRLRVWSRVEEEEKGVHGAGDHC